MSIFGWLKRAPSARADSGTFRPLRCTDALRPSEYRGDGGRYMSGHWRIPTPTSAPIEAELEAGR